MLPRFMRQVFLPSKLTRAFARDSCGMWISTSDASGTTSGLRISACSGSGLLSEACPCQYVLAREASIGLLHLGNNCCWD